MAQTPLFKKLILDVTDASSEVSQPVAMNGDNTAQCAVQIMALTGTTPTATFLHQGSMDLENWFPLGSAEPKTTVAAHLLTKITAIACAYVRLKVTVSGTSSKTVLAADMTTSTQ